ncbi:MAG: hypothetical protein EZS28_007229 [Streblomastix strix]|uniref:Tyr recombinase domain-containing protein n=1 Tax=Streblomastix strix TaxID=222440 RepID=A0A5J4WR35_9EUKA|nr:MAG: hypothetical protein EZS28_007229 [Streblomastix strix]
MSIAKISELLTLLIKKIGIDGFDAYSIKHAYTTKLAEMVIKERDLNMFTNHELDSKSARNYYVFAAQRQVNGIAARLVTIYHCMENQDSTSTNVSYRKKKNEARNGGVNSLRPTELKVKTSNVNIDTNTFQTTPVIESEELRFKPTDERDRAAKQQDQIKTSKTSKLSISFNDSSHGPLLRKPEPTPGQSLMIKDHPCLDASNQCK